MTLRVCLNGEPFLTLEPAAPAAPGTLIDGAAPASTYRMRRHRHPAGSVTCVCVDEFVSLPPRAALALHYTSGAPPWALPHLLPNLTSPALHVRYAHLEPPAAGAAPPHSPPLQPDDTATAHALAPGLVEAAAAGAGAERGAPCEVQGMFSLSKL